MNERSEFNKLICRVIMQNLNVFPPIIFKCMNLCLENISKVYIKLALDLPSCIIQLYRIKNKRACILSNWSYWPLQYLNQSRTKMQNISMLTKSFFLQKNRLEAKLQLLLLVVQSIIFIGVINQANYAQFLPFLKDESKVLIILLITIFLRFSLQVQIVELFGLVILQSLGQYNNYLAVLNALLLAILFVSSTLSSISFDFSTHILHSQSNNLTKVYLRLITITCVTIMQILPNNSIFHILSCISFVLLFLVKSRSLIKDQGYREVCLRLYLWTAFQHLRIFLSFFSTTNTVFVAAAFFVCSQLAFRIYNHKTHPSLSELMAKGDYLSLGFYVLKSQSQPYFNQETESFVNSLNSQEEMQQHLSPLRSVTQLIYGKLDETNNFLANIMRAEIHIMNGNLLKAAELLALISERLKWFDLIEQIIIYRMRKDIEGRFIDSQVVTIAYEAEYRAFLQFQQLLYKAALQNLRFNLCMNKAEIDSSSLKESCRKIFEYEGRIQQIFQSIKDSFAQSTLLYVGYIVQIKNDYRLANDILTIQRLKSTIIVDFNLDQKFYIKVKPEENSLVIEKVGFKVKELLGYDRKDLEGQKVERLVPYFFRKHHKQLVNSFIHKHTDKIDIFQKKTIVLNNKNTYNNCFVMVKLYYRICEDFSYEGHFRITPNNKHDLDSYIIVCAKGNIVECSRTVIDEEMEDHPIIEHYFNHAKIGQPLVLAKYEEVQIYEPIVKIKEEENAFYFYAKCIKNQLAEIAEIAEIVKPVDEKDAEVKPDAMLEQIQTVINNKQVPVLLIILILLLGCLFFGQYLLLQTAQMKHIHQDFIVTNGKILMRYYNNSFRLGLAMTYIDMRDHFNYTNDAWCQSMDENAVNLHQQNEQLKLFNLGTYSLATDIPGMVVYHSNYNFIGMLYSEVLIYNKFRDDVVKQKAALNTVRAFVPALFTMSLTDYRISLLNKSTEYVQNDIKNEYLSVSFTFSSILMIFILAFRLYSKIRNVELEVLSFRFANPLCKDKTDHILEYLKTISLQSAPIDKITQQIRVYNSIVKTQAENTFLTSEVSMVRENTGRKFMNQTNPLEEVNPKALQVLKQEKVMTQSSSYRLPLTVFLILIGVISGIGVCNLLINSIAKNIDETTSLSNIVTVYRASGLQSRILLHTLNTMLIRQIKGIDNSKYCLQQIAGFKAAMSAYTYPIFPQAQFPEFVTSSSNLRQLTQLQICSFMNCSTQYQSQIDVNYLTLIRTITANISQFITNTAGMNSSALATFLNSKAHYINLLYQSQRLLREYVVWLSIQYLDNYAVFAHNLLESKNSLIAAMIGLSSIMCCYWIYLVLVILREKELLEKILKIYQTQDK